MFENVDNYTITLYTNAELARGPRKRGITQNEFVLCLYEKRSRWQGRFRCDNVMATMPLNGNGPCSGGWLNYHIPLSQTLESYNPLTRENWYTGYIRYTDIL